MSEIAIKAVDLSKVYSRPDADTGEKIPFNALNNVSFELNKGEVLGIVGKNGSGKSTLLRVLSGITKPSKGHVEINGTVASILDVGTGFHPDLSGRKNVYLRGQLLGMEKNDIDNVFDAIVDFSGIGDFLDSPIKHYSSGMFLRLAFSIIIHLRSDILILDEVMSVGDTEFRQKCTQKILEIVTSGKTVIMVSHDLSSILDICTLTALMKDGKLVTIDSPMKVVSNSYLAGLAGFDDPDSQQKVHLSDLAQFNRNHLGFELLSIRFLHPDGSGKRSEVFFRDEQVMVEMTYSSKQTNVCYGIGLTDLLSNNLTEQSPWTDSIRENNSPVGTFTATWTFPVGLFNIGLYYIDIHVFKDDGEGLIHFPRAAVILMQDRDDGVAQSGVSKAPLLIDLEFSLKPIGKEK